MGLHLKLIHTELLHKFHNWEFDLLYQDFINKIQVLIMLQYVKHWNKLNLLRKDLKHTKKLRYLNKYLYWFSIIWLNTITFEVLHMCFQTNITMIHCHFYRFENGFASKPLSCIEKKSYYWICWHRENTLNKLHEEHY